MNIYQKLRPWTDIEACQCHSVDGLVLVDIFTDNPIHCANCRREVDPERLHLPADEVEAVARWFSERSALNRLWLDSGEYESYAKKRLSDPEGQVNRHGLDVARLLSARVPTRLWWFHDADDGDPTQCPVCGRALDTDVNWGTGRCPVCPVQV